ncbi:MAG: GxxExxY protein [Methylacidiphilales bacterium]|nr:GxxExxY protein [Candidatus Methylacidiphilales bacterium]
MKYMNRNGDQGEDDPLSSKVIGLAIKVHTELGTGFVESIYHRALEIELAEAGLDFISEAPLTVSYHGKVVGNFIADLVIERRLLLELKALEILPLGAEVQTVNYLKASALDIGLILNFGTAPLQIKRKYRKRHLIDSDLSLHETET